ncbi:hypothetical protein HGRIS_012900 [Hohenbuehelia grisea]|uniref:Uncharacterized protein n=1 Tax=Hohenbuehelia grisea TaxID=104357 RepID=A0ABR3ITP8_9AGAR
MPSLRRSLSSPTVRSTPYPTSSSQSSRAHGQGHRRSSGSETSSRRVLADIEWWRVADGQRESAADRDHESDDRHPDHTQNQGPVEGSARDAGIESPSTLVSWASPLASPLEPIQMLPFAPFVTLSVSPQTPPRRRHGRESSSSSLESTPEADEPIEGLRRNLADLDLSYVDSDVLVGLPPSLHRRRPCSLAVRSYSFADFGSSDRDIAGKYADFTVSPLSNAPEIIN